MKKYKTGWNGVCKCGHLHDQHGKSPNINYTAGKCKNCSCAGFNHNPTPQPESEGVEITEDEKALLKKWRKIAKKGNNMVYAISTVEADHLLQAQAKQIRRDERKRAAGIIEGHSIPENHHEAFPNALIPTHVSNWFYSAWEQARNYNNNVVKKEAQAKILNQQNESL